MAPADSGRPALADAAIRTDEHQRDAAKGPAAPVKLWQRVSRQPWVAHLIRMFERFTDRLGNQFAAAITYFSFLSLVPVLMLSFATAGFVLSSQPDLIQRLKDQVNSVFASTGGDSAANLNSLIDGAIESRFSVGSVALLIALYTGVGWMTNIREAIRAQWRPRWEQDPADVDSIVVATGRDLFALVVLGLGILVSVALTAVSSSATGLITRALGIDDVGWVNALLRVLPVVLALGASTLLFFFLYSYLPRPKGLAPRRKVWRGAIFAAVVFELFKLLLSFLVRQFSSSATAAVFGSVIALLLFMNLVARLLLMVAAWIATSVLDTGDDRDDLAVVIRPQYRVRNVPAVLGGLGIGAAAGWVARTLRRRRS